MSFNVFNGTMTSKQRVLTAFAHETPDRVPMNYMANPAIAKKVADYLGVSDFRNKLAVRKALGCDFVGVGARYTGPQLFAPVEGRNIDPLLGIHTRWIEHESGGYWDYCDFPLSGADYETIEKWPMPDPDQFDYDSMLGVIEANKDMAVYIGDPGLGDVINTTGMLMGMEDTLVNLITEDEATLLFIKRRTDFQLARMERILEKAKGKIDLVWMGEDLGTQNSPIISLDLYRKAIRPIHQQIIDLAKAYKLPVMIHSCGSSSWAFNDFIEMGINIVDTLQPEAKDMAPAYLKKTYGDKLAFHGCISTAGPLAYGTVEETVANCKEILDVMMPGGGYCFCPTHQIQDNSPLENVIAAYQTAHDYGRYK